MPQREAVQDYLTFINGWVAEGGPFAQVGQAFLDGENIIVDPDDGAVYRRKGLGSAGALVSTANTTGMADCGRWVNPGGDTSDFIVIKAAEKLHFYPAGTYNLPSNKKSFTVDLTNYKADGTTTDATIRSMRVSMCSGKGYLFVAGPYIETLYIEYDSGTDGITVNEITFYERDFDGANRQNVDPATRPSSYDADHMYNLRNAGWSEDWINRYLSQTGYYPARAYSPWAGVEEYNNIISGRLKKTFNANMIQEEEFGNTEGPRGSFLLNVFDTRTTVSDTGPTDLVEVIVSATNVTANGDGSYTYDMTATVEFSSAPTDVTSNLTINGAFDSLNDPQDYYVNGDYIKTYVNATHTLGANTSGFVYSLGTIATSVTSDTSGPVVSAGVIATFTTDDESPSESAGQYTASGGTSSSVGVLENRRFEHVGFFAGRLFSAGCTPATRKQLSGRVYYSQLISAEYQIGRCFQENDPTAKNLNELLDTDGGYINIPEMGSVKAMHTRADSLTVIAENGVWEVKAGADGFFLPSSYSVRRISSFGMPEFGGSIAIDSDILYWSEEGIKRIGDSEITALSAGTDISGERIKSYINEAVDSGSMASCYDPYEAVGYWLLGKGTEVHVLAVSLRTGAFYKWTFDDTGSTNIKGIFVGKKDVDGSGDRVEDNLYFITSDSDSYDFAQLTVATHVDTALGDTTSRTAYIETRNDNFGDAARPKQTPKLYTYMERASGASCYARGKFEWTSSGNTGKWNNSQQAYRDRGANYDVALSRLSMRGWGRSFRVRWESDGNAPFRIYGYTLQVLSGERT